jgi:hypothetical protein
VYIFPPQWMAPEVSNPPAGTDGYGQPADVYSVAVVAWEVLTGRCPFEGMSQLEVGVWGDICRCIGVGVYVCVYVYMYVYMCICMCICVYMCICIYVYVSVFACIHLHFQTCCAQVYLCTYAHYMLYIY